MTMRAAVYVRISADPEGEAAGVERQRQECAALAVREGWAVVATMEDNDLSAYSGKRRPAFEALIEGAQAGDFDVVVCWASDRLYRLMTDLVRITSELAPHVRIATVMGGDVDLTTAEGILRAQVLGSVAEFESRRKAERVRARATQRAGAGQATAAVRPLGWRWADPCPGGEGCQHGRSCAVEEGRRPRFGSRAGLVVHETEAEHLRDGYQRILGGESLRSTTKALRAAGLRGAAGGVLDSSSLRSALLLPRQAGQVAHHGVVVAEAADGVRIVDRETWERVRVILTDPGRRTSPEGRTSTPLGGGLLTCGRCGGPMSASNRHEDTGVVHPIYTCSREGCHLSRRRVLLDGPVLAMARHLLVGLAEAGLLAVQTRPDPEVEPTRAAIVAAEGRLAVLAGLVAEGGLDPRDFAAASKRLRADIEALNQTLAKQEGRPATGRLLAADEGVGAAFDALVERAHGGDPDLLRVVLREVFGEVRVDPPAVAHWPTPGDVVVRWADWIPGQPPTSPYVEAGAVRIGQTERRAEVARLRAQGLSINEIAEAVGVNRSTVRYDLRAAA